MDAELEKYLPIICKSSLFKGATKDHVIDILECVAPKIQEFQKGEYLFKGGEPTTSLGLMIEGRALVIKEDFWGNRNILYPVISGGCFAEAFACAKGSIPDICVVSETKAVVMYMNVQKIVNSCPKSCNKHNFLVSNLLADIAQKNINFTEKLIHLGERNVRGKLLSYLSLEARRQNSLEFDIPFSRQELADFLFAERSGISAELCKMRDEGLIEFNKNHFKIIKQD